MNSFRPMLAQRTADQGKLIFPLLASPKLDGIRAEVIDGKLLSRSLKMIPNTYTQLKFGIPDLEGVDGELVCGDPCSTSVFRKTSSAVMSVDGVPDVKFYVFDSFILQDSPFVTRLRMALQITKGVVDVIILPQTLINSLDELLELEEHYLEMGYEGVMLRSIDGKYKFGRSTVREGYLLKLKRFEDAEAKVVGFIEEMQNTNEQTKNNVGKSKRSSHKAGMVGKNSLGSLTVVGINGAFKNVEFNVGSGLTKEEKSKLWENKNDLIGRILTYRYLPIGCKDKPRIATFVGFRNIDDM